MVWLHLQGPSCWKRAGTGGVHHPAWRPVLHRQLPGRLTEGQEWSSVSQALRFLPRDPELARCSQSGKATGWPVRVVLSLRLHYMTEVTTLKSGLYDSKVHVCSLLQVMINTVKLLTQHLHAFLNLLFCTFEAFIRFNVSLYRYLLIFCNHF